VKVTISSIIFVFESNKLLYYANKIVIKSIARGSNVDRL